MVDYNTYFICIAAIAALIYSSPQFFQKLMYYPGQTYKSKLLAILRDDSKKIKVISQANAGYKFGPLRRRMIVGASKPFNYSTNSANHQYIIIDPADASRIDEFVNDLSAQTPDDPKRKKIYGFFHPYCNAGGGGERVLWQAVHDVLNESEFNIVAIYTGDTIHGETTELEIVENVKKRFNLDLKHERLVLVHLAKRHLVDGSYWKRWTLLGQAYGSVVLATEAMTSLPPDIFIDTMGFPFSYPLVKFFLKIPIVSYTHFPIIQQEMISKFVNEKNNESWLSLKKSGKYIYWKIFMIMYAFTGFFIDIPLCNGTWTYNHLNKIWRVIRGDSKNPRSVKLEILYPPCSTEDLVVKDSKINSQREPLTFISLAQFRPEKRHSLIISQFAKFVEKFSEIREQQQQPKLILIGSIRNDSDLEFVQGLKKLANDLNVEKFIEFITDAPFDQVKQLMKAATFGINAMWNEHFGIAVVEMMASGLIPINHASAGPYLDIAVNWDLKNSMETFDKSDNTRTGFFFKSREFDFDYNEDDEDSLGFKELNEVFLEVSKLTDFEKNQIRERAQDCVLQKFSNSTFDKQWLKYLEKMDLLELSMRDEKDKNVKLY